MAAEPVDRPRSFSAKYLFASMWSTSLPQTGIGSCTCRTWSGALLTAMAEDAHTAVVRIPPCWTGVEPRMVLDASAELGLEGIVCKRLESAYLPGRRSPHWIKTPLRRRSPFVVGG